MGLDKWSDDEIQRFLDQARSQEDGKLREDNKLSEETRRNMERYAALYKALDADGSDLRLSSNFADKVLARIQAEPLESGKFSFWQIILAVLGIAAGAGLAAFFLGAPFFAGAQSQVVKTVHSLSGYLSNLDIDFGLLGSGLFILAVLSAIDHLLNQSKRKLATLWR